MSDSGFGAQNVFTIYEALFENTSTQLAYLDSDYNFIMANSPFVIGSGYRREELINRNYFDVFPDDEDRQLFEKVKATGQGIKIKARSFKQLAEGNTYLDWTLNPVKNGSGEVQGFVLSLYDVTEVVKTKQPLNKMSGNSTKANHNSDQPLIQLQDEQNCFRAILEQIPVGVTVIDALGQVIFRNQKVTQIWKYSQAEIRFADDFFQCQGFHPDGESYKVEEWPLARSILKGEVVTGEEISILRGDGNQLVVQIDSTPIRDNQNNIIGGVSVTIDTTERKRAEEALQKNDLRLKELVRESARELAEALEFNQQILEKSPIGIITINSSEQLVYANEAALVIIGGTKEQLCKVNVNVIEALKQNGLLEDARRVLATGIKAHREIHVPRNMFGQELYIECYLSRFTHGDEPHLLYMFQDIKERKRGEEALRQSEERFRKLFHASPILASIVNVDDGVFLDVNQAWLKTMGYERHEIIGKDSFNFDKCRENMERRQKIIADLKSNDQGITSEIVLQPKNGAERAGIISSELIKLNGKLCVINQIVDITERKKAEQYLAERLFMLDNVSDVIIAFNLDYRITYFNKSAEKVYGYSAEEVLGRPSEEVFKPIYLGITPEEALNRLTTTGVLESEAIHITKDGRQIIVESHAVLLYDAGGQPTGFIGINRDITKRVQYEEAIVKERELLMVTLNSLTEGVIAVDSGNRIFLINKVALDLTGYSELEAIDESLEKILNVVDEKTSEPVNSVTLQRLRHPVLVNRDLKEVAISIKYSPIKSRSGEIIGTVIVFQDITEKQKTERELLRAEKLESLGILAGGIAHDFNNLLAAILSNIQLAQLKYKKNEEIGKYLQESVNSTRRASELTRQLLTFSKGGPPVKKTASLAELIHDTAKFALRGSHVKVVCDIDERLWPVEVDTGQISQVIHNLVINAKQAMPQGGIITITTENVVIGSEHHYQPGNYVRIMVKDQGVGIPKENLLKIFDPFFTTKKEGNGLGLASAYSIIKQHDGYLEVESEVSVGTTFFIYLPALAEISIGPEVQNEVAVANEKLRILLMDDEEIILKTVSEMLEYCGHQVTVVRDGMKAIKAYEQALNSGSPFDIVIMDLTIPGGMGAQEAIVYLRKIDPKIKAIVSSGYANDPIISQYERFGFSGVVTKPYKLDELNAVLNQVVEQKQLSLKLSY
ncbi:MAG TPA: PAS domain S-box protein [Bacillota bacterium]|nr:PAS domain S-box protein [Bacillota bacterium]